MAHIQSSVDTLLAVTVISVEEQLSGWYTQLRKAKSSAKLAATYQQLAENVEYLSNFRILAFPEPAILLYESLKTLKLGIGKMDLRIGAIVLHYDGILVTRNLRDFRRIPDLKVEDWTTA
jgi:tRNA(fMet)-specific endonuclease VapC